MLVNVEHTGVALIMDFYNATQMLKSLDISHDWIRIEFHRIPLISQL